MVADNLRPKERFNEASFIYDKARPNYPDKAIQFIIKHCNLKPNDLVADIGCGTGISSRALSKHGLNVLGIEPNENMRKQAVLANEALAVSQPPRYQEGSAENTHLENSSVTAIVSAQAFHWFDTEKSLFEFVRILKPKGHVILMWNLLDEAWQNNNRYSDLMIKHGEGNEHIILLEKKRDLGNVLIQSPLFTAAAKYTFTNEQDLDEQGLINRALSNSYAPKDPKSIEDLTQESKQLFRDNNENGLFKLKYQLELYVACRP